MSDDMLPKDIDGLHPLHTLQTDLAEAMSKVSKVDIITTQVKAEEIKAKEREEEEALQKELPVQHASYSRVVRNSLIALASIVVILASGYGIFYTARQRSAGLPVPYVPPAEDKQILIYDTRKEISFSVDELLNKDAAGLRLLNDAKVDSSGTTFFKLNTSLKSLLPLLSPSMPSAYQRTIRDEDFFGGTATGNFFILRFDSYEQAYAGQLEWENSMKESLLPFFGLSASSTLAGFNDRVVANKDVRAALDAKGNTLFVYGFYRTSMLIFARNEETYRQAYEMLLRQDL